VRVADRLRTQPSGADRIGFSERPLSALGERVLEMLASNGIFNEEKDGKFYNTAMSTSLRSDAQPSMRDVSLMLGSSLVWSSWGELLETVRSGQPAFEGIHRMPIFAHMMCHPEDAAVFAAGMTSGSSLDIAAVVGAYDFSRFQIIADVGGSQGALLAGILASDPRLCGILADLPPVVAGAELLRNSPVADRCEFVSIDFFEAVPEGADAYVLKWVIHDWNDEQALRILRNCRKAIQPKGRLLLIEHVLKPANEFDLGRMLDIGVMTLAKGRERTEREYQQLLQEAGFALNRVIETGGLLSIIESTPL
jgi:hypothetical protein